MVDLSSPFHSQGSRQRAEYEQKSIENGLDLHKLTTAVKEDRVARESLPQLPVAVVKPKPKELSAQCGKLNLAKIVKVSNVHAPEVRLAANVGFYRTFKIATNRVITKTFNPNAFDGFPRTFCGGCVVFGGRAQSAKSHGRRNLP